MEEIKLELDNDVPQDKNSTWTKLGHGLQKAGRSVAETAKNLKQKTESKIQDIENERAKKKALKEAFEAGAREFTINFKNGKKRTINCLYYSNGVMKLRETLIPSEISFLEDALKQRYLIKQIDLSPEKFEYEFNGEYLTMDLYIMHYEMDSQVRDTINNSINLTADKMIIKGSTIGNGSSQDISKETNTGVGFNIFKKRKKTDR